MPAIAAVWVCFGYVGHWRSAEARPSFLAYIWAGFVEWLATIATWLMFPLGVRKSGPWASDAGDAMPVVLIHGYMMNRSSMYWIAYTLKRMGFTRQALLDPRPLYAPMEEQADWIAREVRRYSQHCGGRRVAVVAHSQGGVLARIAAVRHPDLPLEHIVTIGSPHRGTRMAKRSRTANGIQMRFESPFLVGVGTPDVPVTSIYSDLDNIVFPKSSSAFGEAIELHAVGHHALCFSGRVAREAVRALSRKVEPERRT